MAQRRNLNTREDDINRIDREEDLRSFRNEERNIYRPESQIAESVGNERRVITANYVGSNLSNDEYLRHGFQDLDEGDLIVNDLKRASHIEHINVNGERKLYKARNFKIDPYNPENLLMARDRTDEDTSDPDEIAETQLEALRLGGNYRLIYKQPDITTRTGGAFLWFLREEFPFSLADYGIYKKSEWGELNDIEIFNSCLVHCFKDYKHYERVKYSKASIYTLCSKKVFAIIADMTESNIIVHKIQVYHKEKKQNGKNYSKARLVTYYGEQNRKYDEDFHICLIQGHYFPFKENSGFTTSYIKNCIWREKEIDPKELKRKYGLYKSKISVLNSFNLVKLMIEMKDDYFEDFNSSILREPRKEEIDDKIKFKDYEQFDVDFDSREFIKPISENYDEWAEYLKDIQNDIYNEEELFNDFISNIETRPKTKPNNPPLVEKEIFHGDIETRPNSEGRHIPYLMAYSENNGYNKHYFWGENCVRKCLNHLATIRDKNKNTIFKFQNLGFDITQIRDELSSVVSSVEPSKSKVYRLIGYYKPDNRRKEYKIFFTDQYPQIPMKLDNYEKSFNLKRGKTKGYRHDFYANIKRFENRNLIAPHSCYNELLKIFDKKYIKESIDGKRLIIDYRGCAIDYCQQDVETQRQGWVKMHKQVEDELDLDYNRYMTISNLSKAYCAKKRLLR